MIITDIRLQLATDRDSRLLAYGSLVVDNAWVVRELKLIRGDEGYFLNMPCRKLMDHCPTCQGKNILRARFCNWCGARLTDYRAKVNEHGKEELHADTAHPINAECRRVVTEAVVREYERMKEPSK